MTEWKELQPAFRHAVLRERSGGKTIDQIAAEIPAHHATVYRMINGETTPSKALHGAAERFVASHLRRSDTAPDE